MPTVVMDMAISLSGLPRVKRRLVVALFPSAIRLGSIRRGCRCAAVETPRSATDTLNGFTVSVVKFGSRCKFAGWFRLAQVGDSVQTKGLFQTKAGYLSNT